MNRIDWVIVRRLLGNIGLTLTIMYGLVLLIVFDLALRGTLPHRGAWHCGIGGGGIGCPWLLDTLPLTVLVGAIAGLLNLQSSREMTVIKASGASVWRLMRAPIATALLIGLAISLGVQAAVVTIDRGLTADGGVAQVSAGTFWLDERTAEVHYILEAGYVHPGGELLGTVSVFMLDLPRVQFAAETAEADRRRMGDAGDRRPATSRRMPGSTYRLPPPDHHIAWRHADKAEFGQRHDHLRAGGAGGADERPQAAGRSLHPVRQAARFAGQLVWLPGHCLRIYGRLLKDQEVWWDGALWTALVFFVVYVVTEMAGRAGEAGVIQPVIAVLGPAVVAIVAGATVLLNREDGRTPGSNAATGELSARQAPWRCFGSCHCRANRRACSGPGPVPPEGFFTELPEPGAAAQVEANTLNYDAVSDVITATGRVVMNYSGYILACDSLRYDQATSSAVGEGNVQIRDLQDALRG